MKKDQPILPLSESTVDIILMLEYFFNDSKKVIQWLTTKNLNLGNVSLLHLIQIGKSKKLQNFIIQALDENGDRIFKLNIEGKNERDQKTKSE